MNDSNFKPKNDYLPENILENGLTIPKGDYGGVHWDYTITREGYNFIAEVHYYTNDGCEVFPPSGPDNSEPWPFHRRPPRVQPPTPRPPPKLPPIHGH